jgi:hypothetical protein
VSDGYDFNPFQDAPRTMDPNSPFAQNEFARTQNQMNSQNSDGTSAAGDPMASQRSRANSPRTRIARELGDHAHRQPR